MKKQHLREETIGPGETVSLWPDGWYGGSASAPRRVSGGPDQIEVTVLALEDPSGAGVASVLLVDAQTGQSVEVKGDNLEPVNRFFGAQLAVVEPLQLRGLVAATPVVVRLGYRYVTEC